MTDVLQALIGQWVEVRSQSGNHDYRDDGTLQAYDDRWIVLQNSAGEQIYFPITNVRLLKPLR